ncbi:hypothetical protein HY620_03320 [Candidatus Uhrbacteria bacterium]|nr:hypothetical protein [Candidatus Uhrbacteria bacterium]
MFQSRLCTRTSRESPKDEVAMNAQLLERAGFVQKAMAGVYSYLPLGRKVLDAVENIVREEMVAVNGQEIFLPALHPKEHWLATGRWDGFDALFKITSRHDFEYALGPTHEEMLVPTMKKYIQSYKDLPFSVFQIQTKFRDEARAKSGLLRGREFRMKDMYSFHASSESLDEYYERVTYAYKNVFRRLGLTAYLTEASGGTFSKYSHEFQVPIETGEDTIFYCSGCDYAVNSEISEQGICTKCGGKGMETKASEVGNIFKLNTKYSDPFDLTFTDESGEKHRVIMGCYGIGTSRLVGTIVEAHHDSDGIKWPEAVAPYAVHLLALSGGEIRTKADALYSELRARGISVLFDEREDVSIGEKLKDSDLIGLPHRIIVSEKSLVNGGYEYKKRAESTSVVLPQQELLNLFGQHS